MEPCRPQYPQDHNILAGIPSDSGHRTGGPSHAPNRWTKPTFRSTKRQQWRPPHNKKRAPISRGKRQELIESKDDLGRLRNPFHRDFGGAAQPLPKVPQLVAPSTKGQKPTFSKMMAEAFDLKDPMALGKRLASLDYSSPRRESKSWPFQRSFGPCSADESNSGVSSASSGFGSSKAAAKPELVAPVKIKTEPPPFNPFGVGVKTEPPPALVPAQPQSSEAAVNFSITPPSSPNESMELSTLFRLIEANTHQSMMLSRLVSKYFDSSSDSSTDGILASNASSKPFKRNSSSHGYPLVATLSGGGDSPDPPTNPQLSLRGHMIDKVGFNGAGTDANNERDQDIDLENLWRDDSRTESPQLGSAHDKSSSSTKNPPTPPSSPTQYCGICGYGTIH